MQNVNKGKPMHFTAELKRYDPDEEDEATFDTRKEAEEWLVFQRRFGLFSMWVNGERQKFHAGNVIANDEPYEER